MKQPILSEENFEKLSQLDRIEFRQKRDELNRRYSVGGGLVFVVIFFWLWFIGAIVSLGLVWVVTYSNNLMLYILGLMRITLWIWGAVFVFVIVGEIFTISRKKKAMDKLQTDYLFKVPQPEIKKKILFTSKEVKEIKKAGRPKKIISLTNPSKKLQGAIEKGVEP